MARILLGKATDSYDFDILDYSNELGGSSGQTQINSARIYELTSKNGVIVSIGIFDCFISTCDLS